jgi:group I intron endonuclease
MTIMLTGNGAGVYAIRHLATSRCYVGSTVNLQKRWQAHRRMLRNGRHHSVRLQNAWNKYSEQQFEFVVLEIVPDKTAIVAREQHWIEALRSSKRKSGYNVCSIAYSKLGVKSSAETRRKQSLAMQGFKPVQTEEFRQNAMKFLLGHKQSPETIAKRAAALRGKKRAPFTEAHCRNISLGKSGYIATEDTRAKLSKTTTAYWQRKRMEANP